MMIDLLKELQKEKRKEERNSPLEEINEILENEFTKEETILNRLKNSQQSDTVIWEEVDQTNVFDLKHIKKLCIKYRLRFLDSSLYTEGIPYEAVLRIKDLEGMLGKPLTNFKILAPKQLFKLSDKDSDPILFLELSNNKYYVIHKWGGELNFFRLLLAFPMRDFMSMFFFLFALSLIFSYLVPTPSMLAFAFLTIHSFIGICGLACLVMLGFRENFSEVEWDSQYLS